MTRLFLGITERTTPTVISGDTIGDDVEDVEGEGCAGDTEAFSFRLEGGKGRQGHECAWKLLGDLYTYAHKLPPMCFVADGDGSDSRGERLLETGTKAAVAAQQVDLTQLRII